MLLNLYCNFRLYIQAEIAKGKISFISPLARILLNKKIGETAILKLERKDRIFEILEINY